MLNYTKKLFAKLKVLKLNSIVGRFITHNKSVFVNPNSLQKRKSIILMELSSMQSSHIAYSYLGNALAREYNAKLVGYVPRVYSSNWKLFAFKIAKVLNLSYLSIYRSFGVSDFIAIEINDYQRKRAINIYNEIIGLIEEKRDVEQLCIHKVWVGDLIYDSYLARFKKPTIEKDNPNFKKFLLESIELFLFWESFLDDNDVRAINVSHCVYNVAMPLRIGVERKIPIFQTNATHIYRMTKKNLFAYNDFFYFRERFNALPEEVKTLGVEEAKRRINRRFAGEVGVDMAYSAKSAYGENRFESLLVISTRKKILIATHCFFDSPHSYGNNLFPDFYEWLDFLGKISEITDYDWYIKTHPDYIPGTMEIIEGFIQKYPKLTLLPSNASHHQIIAEGIDVALTVYGTIAFEYAALGITVINCSINNPHIAYDFNVHPTSVEGYRQQLLGLNSLKFKIDKQQVYEYYFMKFIFNTEDLFFNNYEALLKRLGGYPGQFTPDVYKEWMAEWTPSRHNLILEALQNYIRSGDFRMDYRHFGGDFAFSQ